jgi:S1-C subfamily serine protease
MRQFSIVGFVCLCVGLLAGLVSRDSGSNASFAQDPQSQPRQIAPGFEGHTQQLTQALAALPPQSSYLPEELVSMAVYEQCNRSVVHINTKSVAIRSFLQVSFREGAGSGSVLNRSGLILTNQHVIDGAREITVSLYNGASYPAVMVGQDPQTDIAVLKIEAPENDLVPIAWGNSKNLRVGQRIYAIGNPFGLERTMSTGMISSLNRQIPSQDSRTMRALIQIDASINQGNSGGPLFNTRGELIGMNTAIMSSDGDSAGVGFAIASSTLERIVPQLIENGRVLRPTIGIARVYETEKGLLVVSLVPGGAAEQAGIQGFELSVTKVRRGAYSYEIPRIDPKDLIIAVDGEPVSTADDLLARVENKKPHEQVVLTIVRGSTQIDVPVTLGVWQ